MRLYGPNWETLKGTKIFATVRVPKDKLKSLQAVGNIYSIILILHMKYNEFQSEVGYPRDIPKIKNPGDFAKIPWIKIPKLRKILNPGNKNPETHKIPNPGSFLENSEKIPRVRKPDFRDFSIGFFFGIFKSRFRSPGFSGYFDLA